MFCHQEAQRQRVEEKEPEKILIDQIICCKNF